MIDPTDWQSSAGEVEGLIRDLTQQVRMLRQAVEEFREEVFAESPHRRPEPVDAEPAPAVTPPLQLNSMPLDPCDPEFGPTINEVDVAEPTTLPTELPRAATLNEFVARFTSEPSADQIDFHEWTEGRNVESGVVVEVDDDLFDWFADNFDAEYEAPGGAYVLAGGNGAHYALWSTESDIFLRQFTEAEAEEFAELMRIAEEKALRKREQFRNPQVPQKQQGCLW